LNGGQDKIYKVDILEKNMIVKSKGKGLVLSLVFAISFIFAISTVSAGFVTITTIPEQTEWIADGVTEYRLDVYADNTALYPEETRRGEWQIWPEEGLTFVRSELPSPANDFFGGFNMDFLFNFVDNSSDLSGRLTENARRTEPFGNGPGPSNKTGILGSYYFTVNPNTPLGELKIHVVQPIFGGSDGAQNNGGQEGIIYNHPIIVPEVTNTPLPGDADLDDDVDLDDFIILKNNFGRSGVTQAEGDFTGDGNVDLDDFIILKNNFGTSR